MQLRELLLERICAYRKQLLLMEALLLQVLILRTAVASHTCDLDAQKLQQVPFDHANLTILCRAAGPVCEAGLSASGGCEVCRGEGKGVAYHAGARRRGCVFLTAFLWFCVIRVLQSG